MELGRSQLAGERQGRVGKEGVHNRLASSVTLRRMVLTQSFLSRVCEIHSIEKECKRNYEVLRKITFF